MIIKGIDYSSDRPGGAALAAAGKQFAIRYMAEDARGLTIPERDDLRSHGIALVAVYEGRGGEPKLGYPQGRADASYAERKMAELGFPAHCPAYFAVDFDVVVADLPVIGQYFKACCDEMGVLRVGVYGDYDVLEYLKANGLATWFWQAGARSWSSYREFPGRHIQQFVSTTLNGAAIDPNDAHFEDYGQWEAEDMADPRVDDILKFLGGYDAVKRWLDKGNVGLIEMVTSEQQARGEVTNSLNTHIAEHPDGQPHDHEFTGRTAKS